MDAGTIIAIASTALMINMGIMDWSNSQVWASVIWFKYSVIASASILVCTAISVMV